MLRRRKGERPGMSIEAIPETPGPSIVGRGLVVTYGSGEHAIRALDGVDVAIQRGEFLCVMGPSGSGKSTLLHVLAGLIRPTAGEVLVAGTAIHALPDAEATRFRRRNVGLVFQFFHLIPTLTVEENVALSLLLDGHRLAAIRDRVRSLAEFLRVEHRLSHYPASLSDGEMQRVAIARALLAEPKLVLADEPTGNLDSKAGDEVLALLRRACDERGVTTLLVTHDLRAASYSDRVLMLQDGRVADEVPTRSDPGAG
jgi:putative ABC transport system ATP-binding protein